jgi:hypothetical protein
VCASANSSVWFLREAIFSEKSPAEGYPKEEIRAESSKVGWFS